MEPWPILRTLQNQVEAELLKNALEAHGIRVVLQSDNVRGEMPQFDAERGVKLRVPPEQLEEAREWLQSQAEAGEGLQ